MLRILGAGLLVVAFCAACDGRDLPKSVVVHDSAGVQIVESLEPSWGSEAPWAVPAEPLLDFATSGEGPSSHFVYVRDVEPLPDGRVAVVDEGTDEIRVFDSDGVHIRSVGRDGEGPGEFRRPISIDAFRGDSMIVWDLWLRRLTVLDRNLNVGRVSRLADPGLRTTRIYWLGDSTFVGALYSLEGVGEEPGYYRHPQQLARFAFDDSAFDTVTTLAGFEGFVFEAGDARPLFGRRSQVVAGPGVIVAGDADHMELRVHDSEGTLRRVARVPDYDLSISEEEMEREVASRTPDNAPPVLKDLVRRLPRPTAKPAYDGLLLDPMGYIWAKRYQPIADYLAPQEWEIFSLEGVWLGLVETPARFEAQSIGQDVIGGVAYDSLDVQHPQVLRLLR